MKKAILIAAMVLLVGLLTGCGTSYNTEESTVFVNKNGTVISTDVETFEDGLYDEAGLKRFVETAVSDYTKKHEPDSVTIRELTCESGKAMLILEYASVADYSAFTGIELFTGSVAETLAAGYRFEGDFACIEDGIPKACDPQDFMDATGYRVVVIKANTNVTVEGKIQYASVDHVALNSKNSVEISRYNHLLADYAQMASESEEESEKGTQENGSSSSGEQSAISANDGSVGEDELETEEADTEVVFIFDDEEEEQDSVDELPEKEFGDVYTYIIYK